MEDNLLHNSLLPATSRPLEVILFDLDGTLRTNRPSSNQTFLDFARQLGVEFVPETRRSYIRWTHFYWAQSPDLIQDVAVYDGDDEEFWTNYTVRSLAVLGCSEAQSLSVAPDLHNLMATEHRPINYVPPDVPVTLQILKDTGLRLGVLSNRRHPCDEELAELGLLHYFDLALVAGEVSSWKPEPQIFQEALARLNAPADAAIYVGDNYYADIVGAERAGLAPVLIDPERIFPEALCPVIDTIGDLSCLLERPLPCQ